MITTHLPKFDDKIIFEHLYETYNDDLYEKGHYVLRCVYNNNTLESGPYNNIQKAFCNGQSLLDDNPNLQYAEWYLLKMTLDEFQEFLKQGANDDNI